MVWCGQEDDTVARECGRDNTKAGRTRDAGQLITYSVAKHLHVLTTHSPELDMDDDVAGPVVVPERREHEEPDPREHARVVHGHKHGHC